MLPLEWPHARRIRDGVIAFAETAGWLLVDSGSADMESKAHLLADADGLICTAGPGNAWIPRLAAGGLPVVNCNEHLSDTPGVISVSVDWSDLFDRALGHFQNLGLRHIALAWHPGHWRPMETFARITEDAGCHFHACPLDSGELPRDIDATAACTVDTKLTHLLESTPLPFGVLCDGDAVALRVCTCAESLGLRIPQDIAVIGQGDRLIGRSARPPLTTLVPPGEAIGRHASMLLQAKLNATPAPPHTRVVGSSLIVRESSSLHQRDAAFERAVRHLDTHALGGITVQELAAIAGLSTKTLRRKFIERLGMDPAAEIRRRRFDEACRLLGTTALPVSEIGRRCGFPSPTNFHNFFRRNASCGPETFRKTAELNPGD